MTLLDAHEQFALFRLIRPRAQVIVLSEGRVVEAGHPYALLHATSDGQESKGHEDDGVGSKRPTLASMVDETGPVSADMLRRSAREAWEASQSRSRDVGNARPS